MRCLFPLNIRHPDKSIDTVPCGKCYHCLMNRRAHWAFRLQQELKDHADAHFITLTYEDDNIRYSESGLPTLDKRDYQLFMKRLRKKVEPIKLRFYACGEYGTRTQRPHYHAIIFGIPHNDIHDLVYHAWLLGHVQVGNVNAKTIAYVTKYCVKPKNSSIDDRLSEFSLQSRRPALGHRYLNSHTTWHRLDPNRVFTVLEGGYKVSLPRYFKDKIYTSKLLNKARNKRFEKKQDFEEKREMNTYRNPSYYYKAKVEQATSINDLGFKRIAEKNKF